MTKTSSNSRVLKVAAGVAIAFGLLTILSGGRALFGNEVARLAVGNAVPFVLWFNFLAGFAYIAAGTGLFLRLRWGIWLAVATLITTLLIFVAFGLFVARGGAYEMRTVGAMFLRSGAWMAIVAVGIRAGIQ